MRWTGLCRRTVTHDRVAVTVQAAVPDLLERVGGGDRERAAPRRLDSEAVGSSQPSMTLPSKAACASGLASSAVERVVGDVHAEAGEAATAATSAVAAMAGSILDIVLQGAPPR